MQTEVGYQMVNVNDLRANGPVGATVMEFDFVETHEMRGPRTERSK
jgi:hypothetical protein